MLATCCWTEQRRKWTYPSCRQICDCSNCERTRREPVVQQPRREEVLESQAALGNALWNSEGEHVPFVLHEQHPAEPHVEHASQLLQAAVAAAGVSQNTAQ